MSPSLSLAGEFIVFILSHLRAWNVKENLYVAQLKPSRANEMLSANLWFRRKRREGGRTLSPLLVLVL
jgi:hypothetical protein